MSDPGSASLPGVDAAPAVEAGIVLLGLDPERLLAGLGLATLGEDLAGDPAAVTLTVDRARHDGAAGVVTLPGLLARGAGRWRALRPELASIGAGVPAGAVREVLGGLVQRLATAWPQVGEATRTHLAACWIRRVEIDRMTDATTGGAP